MTSDTRRDFLKRAGAGAVAATAWPGQAAAAPAPRTNPTLVAIYLRGGADPLGAVVPYTDKEYRRHRPTLAVPGPDAQGSNRALPLDDRFAFNPVMAALHDLYQKGQCVPVVAVGSPHPTRSHFDAQDFMERGAPGQRSIATGWLNRYLHATKTTRDANLRAVSLQPLLPRAVRGTYPVLARPDQKAELALEVYSQLYTRTPANPFAPPSKSGSQQTRQAVQEFGARTIEQLWELNQVLDAPAPAGVKYPDTPFGRQVRDVAKLIKANRGLEVAALDYGGWDHHINEGPLDGQLARQLGDVSNSLGAFATDLGPKLLDRVLVLVMSEFGRTVKENDNRGTDHGHGGFMLAIGGRVSGKTVYGKWEGLADEKLYERRDLPVLTDFRVVFAEALKGTFGFDGIKEGLFPEYTPNSPPLQFLHGG